MAQDVQAALLRLGDYPHPVAHEKVSCFPTAPNLYHVRVEKCLKFSTLASLKNHANPSEVAYICRVLHPPETSSRGGRPPHHCRGVFGASATEPTGGGAKRRGKEGIQKPRWDVGRGTPWPVTNGGFWGVPQVGYGHEITRVRVNQATWVHMALSEK